MIRGNRLEDWQPLFEEQIESLADTRVVEVPEGSAGAGRKALAVLTSTRFILIGGAIRFLLPRSSRHSSRKVLLEFPREDITEVAAERNQVFLIRFMQDQERSLRLRLHRSGSDMLPRMEKDLSRA